MTTGRITKPAQQEYHQQNKGNQPIFGSRTGDRAAGTQNPGTCGVETATNYQRIGDRDVSNRRSSRHFQQIGLAAESTHTLRTEHHSRPTGDTSRIHRSSGPQPPVCGHAAPTPGTTSFSRRSQTVLLRGGEYNDCLSADDIDRLLIPVIPHDQLLLATELYGVRVGDDSPGPLDCKIRALAARAPVIAPLHIRFHWTVAVFTIQQDDLHALVLDSAPAFVTEDDIRKLLQKRLTCKSVNVICPGWQPRHSNECGIHTIVNAWRAFFRLPALVIAGTLRLGHLRPLFASLAEDGARVRKIAQSIATHPLRVFGGQHTTAVTGTGPVAASHRSEVVRRADEQAERARAGALSALKNRRSTSTLRPNAPPFVPRQPTIAAVSCAGLDAVGAARRADSVPLTTCETGPTQRTCDLAGGAPAGPPSPTIIATAENTASYNLCYMYATLRAIDALTTTHVVPRKLLDVWRLAVKKLKFREGEQMDVNETFAKLAETFASFRAPQVVTIECNRYPMAVPKGSFIALDQEGKFFRRPASHEVVGVILYTGSIQRTSVGAYSCGGHYQFVAGSAEKRGGHKCAYVLRPIAPPSAAPPAPQHVPTVAQAAAARAVGQSTQHVQRAQDLASVIQKQHHGQKAIAVARATTARNLGLTVAQLALVEEDGVLARARRVARRDERLRKTQNSTRQDQPESSNDEAPIEHHCNTGENLERSCEEQSMTGEPRRMGRRAFKRFLATCKVGERLFVHWSRLDLATGEVEAGRWFGAMVQTPPSAMIKFDAEMCEDCGCARDFEPVFVEMPVPGTIYFEVERKQLPTTFACVCSPMDMDDECVVDAPAARATDLIDGRCLQQLANMNTTNQQLTGAAGATWFVHSGKPPAVHELVWRQMAASTRANHQRWLRCIRGMPADLRKRPLAHAVTEMVLRMANARRWCWSTVASALSACASAMCALPIYTAELQGLDLKKDPYYAAAMKHAQHLARVATGSRTLTVPMTRQHYERLTGSAGIKAPRVRLLLQMAWHFAARIGDMRQVRPCDVSIAGNQARKDGFVPATVTFRFGKGAAWWGPYTIHALIPKRVAGNLVEAVRTSPADQPLFRLSDQAALSEAVGAVTGRVASGVEGRLNLRSIRRGALLHAADTGVPDEELRLLSGHKRHDTLMRYLGWGVRSSTMQKAAESRHVRMEEPVGGAITDEEISPAVQPPKMGQWSGYTGNKGRRTVAQPKFFPRKVPTREQCGVVEDHDTSDYRLHIKETSRVEWQAVQKLAQGTPLAEAVHRAKRWVTTADFYGPALNIDPRKIPKAALTSDQIAELWRAGKIKPHQGVVKGFVNVFTVPEHRKKRFRVIAEPVINATIKREEMYQVHYPSRLERRARARDAKFSAEIDFSAYFDQFQLAEDVTSWFVMRAKEPVEGHRLFALTRMPMGACFAPSAAQAVTSALVAPLLQIPNVRVDTMIDNVRVVADTRADFICAMRLLLLRVKQAGITMNDAELWDVNDQELIHRCAITDEPRVFLGEKYIRNTIANSDACVEKLQAAVERYKKAGEAELPIYTKRHFASLVGLMLFMAHTVSLPLTKLHTLLRAYGNIIADVEGWDTSLQITSEEVNKQVHEVATHLMKNEPVPLPILKQPSLKLEDYDVAIEVDASGEAWGAKVRFANGATFLLQQRWTKHMGHSAHAEPRAACLAIKWARAHAGCANATVALVTDHVAIVSGQRRWYSNNGGFSTSYWLNELYDELYSSGGGEAFHVDGELNEADQLSRDPSAGVRLKVRSTPNLMFRDLKSLNHPHMVVPRACFQV